MSWPSVVGLLAVFAVSVVTIGALGICALACFIWYAVTPPEPIDPAAEPLIVVLKSEDATVRAQAAGGLGAIGSGARSAIPELKTLLEDKDDEVRLAAAKALANITGWPQRVKRIVGRRLVSRTERQVGDQIEWEELWEYQEQTETVRPGS